MNQIAPPVVLIIVRGNGEEPMTDLLTLSYECASCGEENETVVDITAGARQLYTEDCAVCCRPNLLSVEIGSRGEIRIGVEYDD